MFWFIFFKVFLFKYRLGVGGVRAVVVRVHDLDPLAVRDVLRVKSNDDKRTAQDGHRRMLGRTWRAPVPRANVGRKTGTDVQGGKTQCQRTRFLTLVSLVRALSVAVAC